MEKSSQATQSSDIQALAWNIATEPQLYWQLAPNPYSDISLQIISERFPHFQTVDVIKAIILAEPEGWYDRNFRLLGVEEQTKELDKQKIVSNEMTILLLQFCKKNIKEFSQLPKKDAYDRLSMKIFETGNLKEIEQKFAQHQRRDLRLFIITYLEDPYSIEFDMIDKKFLGDRTLFLGISFITFFITFAFLVQTQNYYHTQDGNDSKHILGTEIHEENKRFPERLKIPSIKVDASVKHVGITADGAMDAPGNTADVGWYKLGPSPGDKGSAVISGHFDGRIGESGVFNQLDKLKPGDKIYIINELGTTTTFVVRESRSYNPGYAEEVFLSNDNGTHLNLVTCNGNWNISKKSYSKRLVVFADIAN